MKCLRITGSSQTKSYTVVVMGENQMKEREDTHDTVMQILRLRMRWDIMEEQVDKNSVFDYVFPITF